MAAQIPVKAIYSGSDVTSLGEFASSDSITATYLPVGTGSSDVAAGDHTHAYLPLAGGTLTGNLVTTGLIDGRDVAADGVLATNAMPKAGGAFTGAITTNSTIDTVDIATRDGVLTTTTTTANAALPKAGGTMTGGLNFGDNNVIQMGGGNDLRIYHDGSNSFIDDAGTGVLQIRSNDIYLQKYTGETMINALADGAVTLYHNNVAKVATTANGVTVTGVARGSNFTDNDGSFDMNASNNFKCTPSGNFTLTFTNIASQSGNILLVNSGGHTVSAHSNTKVDANLLATVSAAGTYLLSYFSDASNVYMTNSAIYT